MQLAVDGALDALKPAAGTAVESWRIRRALRDAPLDTADQVRQALTLLDVTASAEATDLQIRGNRAALLGRLWKSGAAEPAEIDRRLRDVLAGLFTAHTMLFLENVSDRATTRALLNKTPELRDVLIGQALDAMPSLPRHDLLSTLTILEERLDLKEYASAPPQQRKLERALYAVLDTPAPPPLSAGGTRPTWDQYSATESAGRAEFLIVTGAAGVLSKHLYERLKSGDTLAVDLRRLADHPHGGRIADSITFRFSGSPDAKLPDETKTALIDLIGRQGGNGGSNAVAGKLLCSGGVSGDEERAIVGHLLRAAYLPSRISTLSDAFQGLVDLWKDPTISPGARAALERGLTDVAQLEVVPGGNSSQQDFYNASIMLARTLHASDPRGRRKIDDALRKTQLASEEEATKHRHLPSAVPPPSFGALFAEPAKRT